MSDEVQTVEIDWETVVRSAEPRPTKEITYQFPGGRNFTESFIPVNGPYEPEE